MLSSRCQQTHKSVNVRMGTANSGRGKTEEEQLWQPSPPAPPPASSSHEQHTAKVGTKGGGGEDKDSEGRKPRRTSQCEDYSPAVSTHRIQDVQTAANESNDVSDPGHLFLVRSSHLRHVGLHACHLSMMGGGILRAVATAGLAGGGGASGSVHPIMIVQVQALRAAVTTGADVADVRRVHAALHSESAGPVQGFKLGREWGGPGGKLKGALAWGKKKPN